MNNLKLAITWYTYKGDSGALEISVRQAARVLPGASLHVIDDAANPVPSAVRRRLESAGVSYTTTSANRQGNLRGMEWVTTQVRSMAEIARGSGADAVFKCDSDTLVIDPSWLLAALDAPHNMAAGTRSVGRYGSRLWLYGAGYAIKTTALERLEREIDKLPQWAMDDLVIMPKSVHEDVFITRMVYLLYGVDALAIDEWRAEKAWFAGWQYKTSRRDPVIEERWLRVYAARYGCVTFGNRYQIRGTDARKEVARTMRAMAHIIDSGERVTEPLPHFLHVPKTGGESV